MSKFMSDAEIAKKNKLSDQIQDEWDDIEDNGYNEKNICRISLVYKMYFLWWAKALSDPNLSFDEIRYIDEKIQGIIRRIRRFGDETAVMIRVGMYKRNDPFNRVYDSMRPWKDVANKWLKGRLTDERKQIASKEFANILNSAAKECQRVYDSHIKRIDK